MWRWLTALFLVAFPNSTGRFVFSLTFGVGIDVLSLATSVFTCMAFVEGSAVSGIHWISYRFVSACRIDRRAFRWDAFGWVYLTSLSYGWSRDGDVGEPPGRSDATCLIVDRGGGKGGSFERWRVVPMEGLLDPFRSTVERDTVPLGSDPRSSLRPSIEKKPNPWMDHSSG